MDPNWVMQYLRSDRASPVWERDYTSFEAMLTDLQTEKPICPDEEFLNVICLRGGSRESSITLYVLWERLPHRSFSPCVPSTVSPPENPPSVEASRSIDFRPLPRRPTTQRPSGEE